VTAWIRSLIGRKGATPAPERDEVAVREPPPAEPIEPEPEAVPEPQLTVSERSARALLATGPPPLPPERAKPQRRRRRTEPPPPAPVSSTARAWNIWDLQRVAREATGDERLEEWSALLIHLREFANADGELPVEFDGLVRESFAGVLDTEATTATT
jgi:hypothetical protein